jgi:hypothetical protein
MTEPVPTPEDRRKARLLAEGGNFDADSEELFARGIAVARMGGDVETWLREQLGR